MKTEPYDSTFIVEIRIGKRRPNDDRNPKKEVARELVSAAESESTGNNRTCSSL